MLVWSKIKVNLNPWLDEILMKATAKGLEAGALAHERKAKLITTEDNHVITWRFRSSINLNNEDWIQRNLVDENTSDDWIHELNEAEYSIRTWSNVEYAIFLEKRYSIMARALDEATSDIAKMFAFGVKKYLTSLGKSAWKTKRF